MPSAAGNYYAFFDGGQKDQIPIILLHGAGGNHQSWPAEIRRLTGQRVLALDLPGHGRSSGIGLQSIPAYAEQVIEFLTTLRIYQVILVGHGMGGAIALEMAIQNPGLVAGLALISTGAYLGIDRELLEGFSNPYTLNGALKLFQQRGFAISTPSSVVENGMQPLRAARTSVMAADWHACAEFDRRSDIPQIVAPAWIIAGAEDYLTPISFAHFLAGTIPAARLQVFPNCGHMVTIEQPEGVARGIQQFVNTLASIRRSSPEALSLLQHQSSSSLFLSEWNKHTAKK